MQSDTKVRLRALPNLCASCHAPIENAAALGFGRCDLVG
jgi:hypothetical protein